MNDIKYLMNDIKFLMNDIKFLMNDIKNIILSRIKDTLIIRNLCHTSFESESHEDLDEQIPLRAH
jgi:hypothetical protein